MRSPRPKQPTERRSVNLTVKQWEGVDAVASQVGAIATRGKLPGEPSWSALLRMIGEGQLVVTPADPETDTDQIIPP